MSSRKKLRIEPSFVPLGYDLNTRRAIAKRLLDTAKPAVVDGVLILLHEMHREQMIRDLYKAEAKK
jgi:hypothetical protein